MLISNYSSSNGGAVEKCCGKGLLEKCSGKKPRAAGGNECSLLTGCSTGVYMSRSGQARQRNRAYWHKLDLGRFLSLVFCFVLFLVLVMVMVYLI